MQIDMTLQVRYPISREVANRELWGEMVRDRMKQLSRMESCLESGQSELFYEIFDRISAIGDDVPYSYRIELYSAMQTSIVSCLNRSSLPIPTIEQLILQPDYRFSGSFDWPSCLKWLRELASAMFSESSGEGQDRLRPMIVSVNRYIEDHLDKDLALTRVAEMVFLSPTYFSKLYKQETGNGFNEYVTERRISRAEHLLTNTYMRISEIAAEVGYESPPYFMKVFKKRSRMTPQEYRDRFSNRRVRDITADERK